MQHLKKKVRKYNWQMNAMKNNKVFLWNINPKRLELIANHIILVDDSRLDEVWKMETVILWFVIVKRC